MSKLDLLVVGAGPTGIAVGAEARLAGLAVLVVDRGPLVASLQAYPTDLEFFTTRERLEIAGVAFTIPEVKPNRRQALAYYREVVRSRGVPLALHEEVASIVIQGDGFVVEGQRAEGPTRHEARAVALATGYFRWPRRLQVPGDDEPWVAYRYLEPYAHFDQDVVVVGGGNSAVKVALDLHRNGARVTLVHRRPTVKSTIKYWLRPDFDNRVEEGSIATRYESEVVAFHPPGDGQRARVELRTPTGGEALAVDTVYVQIGYEPDVSMLVAAGVDVDSVNKVPRFDPASCETNVPGLYVAGTIQAGIETNRIFIENSRDHGARIVQHLRARLAGAGRD